MAKAFSPLGSIPRRLPLRVSVKSRIWGIATYSLESLLDCVVEHAISRGHLACQFQLYHTFLQYIERLKFILPIMTIDEKSGDIQHFDVVNSTMEIKSEGSVDANTIPIDEAWLAREKRLVRKLDWTLMPTIWVLYLFNYLDRNNIA
jgi:hypothetical protein